MPELINEFLYGVQLIGWNIILMAEFYYFMIQLPEEIKQDWSKFKKEWLKFKQEEKEDKRMFEIIDMIINSNLVMSSAEGMIKREIGNHKLNEFKEITNYIIDEINKEV